MRGLEPFLWVAGALHGLIAVSNLAWARLYRDRAGDGEGEPLRVRGLYVLNA